MTSWIEVEIGDLDPSGLARGRALDGAPARIRGALPGERVRARVEHVGKDGTHYGVVQDVLRAADARVDPECAHYLRCGGCELLHASVEAQHAFKRRRVAEDLGLDLEAVEPVVASPRAFGYRALAKLVVGPRGVLGSYRPRTHDVQDMHGCRVHAPEAEQIVDLARTRLTPEVQAQLRYLLVRASIAQGEAVVTLVTSARPGPEVRAFAEALAEHPAVAEVAAHVNARAGDAIWDPAGATISLFAAAPVVERVGPVVQRVAPGAFVQINPGAAAELYRRAVEGAQAAGRRVLDLYAGSGGVGLAMLAAGAEAVLAVESVPPACAAARDAAERSGVADRFEVREGRVEAALAGVEGARAQVVVLNPPRKGAGEPVMQAILRLAPERLVYVSCNPKSLGRDLAVLEAAGWRAERITPVDLFVHTRHVETVVVMLPP